MKPFLLLFISLLILSCQKTDSPDLSKKTETKTAVTPVLVIHGGAGFISPETINDSAQTAYRNAINEALEIGYNILT